MKNIHVLPTDKPSRLHTYFNLPSYYHLYLSNEALNWKEAKHIYITNDSEIKVGDWYYNPYTNQLQIKDIFDFGEDCKKIILTTDQDLIKDGVQAIDDEFLEWFIKNPSCDRVGVNDLYNYTNENTQHIGYKIIIPKEESKQETQGYICPHTKKQCDDECCVSAKDCHLEASMGVLSEPKQETLEEASLNHFLSTSNVIVKDIKDYDFKQETLEEAAKKEYNDNLFDYEKYRDGFIIGAKWQAERMYSDLSELRNDLYDKLPIGDIDAFEILKVIKNHLQKLDALCGNK